MNTKIAKKYLSLLGFKAEKTSLYFERPVHEQILLYEGCVLKYQEDVKLIDNEKYHRVEFNSSDQRYFSNKIYLSEETLNDKDLFRDPIKTCLQVKLFDALEDLNSFLEENSLKSDCDVLITTDNKFLLKYLRVGDEE